MTYLNGFQRPNSIHEIHGERIKPGKTRKKRPITCEFFHAVRGQYNYELIGDDETHDIEACQTTTTPSRRPVRRLVFSRREHISLEFYLPNECRRRHKISCCHWSRVVAVSEGRTFCCTVKACVCCSSTQYVTH